MRRENIKDISRDIKIYPDSKHSFFNDKGRAYDATTSEDAWTRIQTFFQEHMIPTVLMNFVDRMGE